jgi:hypothetical protein
MRGILISTLALASLTVGASVALAQTPVPNASGSQTTAPRIYRSTAEQGRQRTMMMQQRKMGMGTMTTGSVKKHHAKKKAHHS